MDALSLIAEMRRQKIKFPVIIISARTEVDDRIKSLQPQFSPYQIICIRAVLIEKAGNF
jgi:DNA-binding response OmpR family regulator